VQAPPGCACVHVNEGGGGVQTRKWCTGGVPDPEVVCRGVTIVPPVTIKEHLKDLEDDLEDLENEHQEPCTKALVSPFEFPIQEDDIADDC
jgi:hypothetical protein